MNGEIGVLIQVYPPVGNETTGDDIGPDEWEKALQPLLARADLARRVAENLSLPTNVPVRYELSVGSRDGKQVINKEDVLVQVSVITVPDMMKRDRDLIDEEVRDLLFRELVTAEVPAPIAHRCGLNGNQKVRFEMIHLERPDSGQAAGMRELSAQVDIWGQGGWGKGCSGWPW